MLRRMSTFALLMPLVMSFTTVGHPTDVQAAGRLAAWRAARTAAAEAAATAVAKTAALRTPAVQPAAVQSAPVQTAALQTAPAEPLAAPAPVASQAMPATAGCDVCCPQPCIIYRHRGHHRACCDCAPPIETVLTATNPCTCCPVAIPVCVPACCQCAPTVTCHDGLLCSSVHYDWSCGYRVTVRFKHNGDILVVSRG